MLACAREAHGRSTVGHGRQRLVAARLRSRGAPAWSRSPARRSPRALGRDAQRGGLHRGWHRGRQPRRQGALCWSRTRADPRRTPRPGLAVEHHAVLDPVDWLGRARGRRGGLARRRRPRPGRPRPGACRAGSRTRSQIALVHRDVGQQRGRHRPADRRDRRVCAPRHGVPLHTDAVQAVGSHPGGLRARPGHDAPISAHKLGGPLGVGALLARRGLELTPLLHGGGQEREVRSGTLDAPALAGFAAAVEHAVGDAAHAARRGCSALRDDLVRPACSRRSPDAIVNGDRRRTGRAGCPATPTSSFPGCEGDALLMLLDAAGVECSTGSACTAGVPEPSHVLLAMGVDPVARPVVAALHPRAHLDRRATSTRSWRHCRPPWPAPGARARCGSAPDGRRSAHGG